MVEVIRNVPNTTQHTSGIGSLIIGLIFMSIVVIIAIIIITIIFFKIKKKFDIKIKRKNDVLFLKFSVLSDLTHYYRDRKLKHRRWLFLWKRASVYVKNNNGYNYIGDYEGESYTKDGYYIMNISNKLNWFKRKNYIVLIPAEMEKLIHKTNIANKYSVIIDNCKGMDDIYNTDMFVMPLFYNPDNGEIINFSNKVYKEFIKNFVYDDVIKNLLLDWRDSVKEAVEMNPNLNFKRKDPNN